MTPRGLRDRILAPVTDKLALVELEFERQLRSPIPLIAEINAHLARQAGKRIRPTILLLCARMLGYQGRGDVVLGAVIEFIHTATLIHDDVIDDSDVRRGQKSVKAIWGNNVTVLLGDYLYLKSMELALTARSLPALDVLTQVTIEMIEGELLQLSARRNLALTREEYLEIIRRKTSALFSGCGRIAGLLAEADDERTEALAQYGRHVGMAFQLVDDLLDFIGDEEELGKPVLNDLREGRVTLPVIELVERVPPDALAVVRQVLETGEVTKEATGLVREFLRRHGTLEATATLAHEHAKEARKQLALFPDSDSKRVLELIPEYIVSRTA